MKLLAIGLAGLLVIGSADAAEIKGKGTPTDGDTFVFSVRLFGADTPESKQKCWANGRCYACGQDARKYMLRLTTKRRGNRRTWVAVTCKFTGGNTYGRPVGVCSAKGKNLGEEMIRAGWALAYRQYLGQQPDLRARYIAAEADAIKNKRGMHRGQFVKPWEWRRGKRLACER